MPYAPGTLSFDRGGPSRQDRARERNRDYDRRRGTSFERGYTSRWQKSRVGFLAKHPLCVRCLDDERIVPATVVDHIEPHRGDMTRFWDRANWQALCESCHNSKTAGEDRHTLYMPAGLGPSKPSLTIVCGPPGAGKTTYVEAHCGAGDEVIDLDEIIAGITGSARRVWSRQVVERAMAERNARLRGLVESEAPRAWFIVSAARAETRREWRKALGATQVVVCYAPAALCRARIAQSDERRDVWYEQCAAVDRWHVAFTLGNGEITIRTDLGGVDPKLQTSPQIDRAC